jgi:hypothetical protein
MVSKKLLIGVIVIIGVIAAGLWMLLGGIKPPVDVYARPTPAISVDPMSEDLFPLLVKGYSLLDIKGTKYADRISVTGDYEGGIQIIISKCTSSGAASSYLNQGLSYWEDRSGSCKSVDASEQHWFTFTGGGTSVFAWRKGVWVFVVFAPTETLRNQIVEEMSF